MKKLLYIGLIFPLVISCHKALYSTHTPAKKEIDISNELGEDEKVIDFIAPYKKELENKMNTIIVHNPYLMDKGMNANLSNFAADVLLKESDSIFYQADQQHADMALLNHGGLRRTFTEGDISIGNIFELLPFENKVVIVRLKGEDILKMVHFLKEKKIHPIAGITFSLTAPDGNIKIAGKSFDVNKEYNVATIDYLQQGGDKMNFLLNPVKVYNLDILLREMFLNYLSQIDTIKVNQTPRYLP